MEEDIPSPVFKIGECDSHSYQALFSTATRQIAVSRTAVERVVRVRMEPRKEFLDRHGMLVRRTGMERFGVALNGRVAEVKGFRDFVVMMEKGWRRWELER